MKCNKCNVEIGDSNICPLCHSIAGNNEHIIIKNNYPPKQGKRPLPLKLSPKTIYLIIALIASVACIIANYLTKTNVLWCWFMVSVFAYGYLMIANTIFSNTEFGAKIFLQGAALIALSYIYDAVFKTKVATNYCLPIIISAMIIINGALLLIYHKHNLSLFVSSIFISLLGVLPIILYACKVITILAPPVVAVVLGGISFILVIAFSAKQLKVQFKKVFHF